jgi:hypothetical protein
MTRAISGVVLGVPGIYIRNKIIDVSPRSKKGKVVRQKKRLKRENHLLFPFDREKACGQLSGGETSIPRNKCEDLKEQKSNLESLL